MTLKSESWDTRIQRAQELAGRAGASQELLTFYVHLLQAQRQVDEFLRTRRGWLPSGSLAEDLVVLRDCLPILLQTVEAHGPELLAEEARNLDGADNTIVDEQLMRYWQTPSGTQFFAKALLQPYASWLNESGGRPLGRILNGQENCCPFCGGVPQVSFLQIRESSTESGNRDLVCATCLANWPFRRVVCAYCLEERPFKLGYFQTQEYDHVRIEACDSCKHYIKGIDLTRFGLAVPLVDEVAAAPLDVWAQAHGYTKIELNLLGL